MVTHQLHCALCPGIAFSGTFCLRPSLNDHTVAMSLVLFVGFESKFVSCGQIPRKMYDTVVDVMPLTVTVIRLSLICRDLGGQQNIRPYWRCYYANTNAIIYVVDSADRDRIGLSRQELLAMLEEEELKDTVLLVFANKQDQKDAMSDAEVSEALGLHAIKDRAWHICKCTATKGAGLEEGLDWLSNAITGAAK